jgi:hypothetical protein
MNTINTITETPLPAIGTPMPGGFFTGTIMLNGQRLAIITTSKKLGEFSGVWHPNYADVPGAKSFVDGHANTLAMDEAGSPIAEQALALEIDGFKDFFIPSQDMLELQYRAFKPTRDKNSQYGRSGINVSALPPTYPYTPDLPAQTLLEAFQQGGEESFESELYWTSTQHADGSDCAWCQGVGDGFQYYDYKDYEFLVRAVRSQPI